MLGPSNPEVSYNRKNGKGIEITKENMLKGPPFVGVKARRVKQEQTLIYLFFQAWVQVLGCCFC